MYLGIERRFSPGKRFFRAMGFALIVLAPTVWDATISYRTHGIGFVAGIVFGVVYFVKKKEVLREAERIQWD